MCIIVFSRGNHHIWCRLLAVAVQSHRLSLSLYFFDRNSHTDQTTTSKTQFHPAYQNTALPLAQTIMTVWTSSLRPQRSSSPSAPPAFPHQPMLTIHRILSFFFYCVLAISAKNDGLARTPPMGWRSWNLYAAHVNQTLIEHVMDGVTRRRFSVDGVPTSLADLGYTNVGLDDAWQVCQTQTSSAPEEDEKGHKFSFHDDSGRPLVDSTKFPSFKQMTDKAHKLGLTAGWYLNNCICAETAFAPEAMYAADVNATVAFGFDAVKLDGCSQQLDLDEWSSLYTKTGRAMLMENCHWGRTVPAEDWCPWHYFRTGGDITANYASIVTEISKVSHWARNGLSRPGCWAYPDMLEIGCPDWAHISPSGFLTDAETRAHFGAWCVLSSPLILSLDVWDEKTMEKVWPVISNKEAIAVNQAWAGESGAVFLQADVGEVGGRVQMEWADFGGLPRQRWNRGIVEWNNATGPGVPADGDVVPQKSFIELPAWQYFAKRVEGPKIESTLGRASDSDVVTRVAVLMMNHASTKATLTLPLSKVPGLRCGKNGAGVVECCVRDIWARKDLASASPDGELRFADVETHDAVFLTVGGSCGGDDSWAQEEENGLVNGDVSWGTEVAV